MPVTSATTAAVLRQVAHLEQIDAALLERLRHEAMTVPTEWVAEYGQYQSGGWWTVSLLNDTGRPTDAAIRDCDPVETTLLQRMPVTRGFLSSLGLRYMWARLARLEPNAFLWEHRDYDELDESERHRLHVPLVTNGSATLVTGGARTHMRSGHLWRLTPTHVHGACNLLGPDRIHLVLDCYADDGLARLMANEQLSDGDVERLPVATHADLEGYLDTARALAGLGFESSAERHLLRLFYSYALPEGCTYDLISTMYASMDRIADVERWKANKAAVLGLPAAHGPEGSALP